MLRNLIKSVAGFIGEGAGGVLANIGWNAHEFQAFLDKSETDTAWEAFQMRRRTQKTASSTESMSAMLGPQPGSSKRSSESDIAPDRVKKPRGMNGSDSPPDRHDAFPLLMQMSTTVPPPPPPPSTSMYPSASRSPQENMFSDLIRNGQADSPLFMPATASSTSSHYPTPSSSSTYSSYMPQMNLVDQGMSSLSYQPSKNGAVGAQPRVLAQPGFPSEEPADDDDEVREPKKMEALKLIKQVIFSWIDLWPSSSNVDVAGITLTTMLEIVLIVCPPLYGPLWCKGGICHSRTFDVGH